MSSIQGIYLNLGDRSMRVGGLDLETYGLNKTRNNRERCLLEAEKRYM